MLIAKCMWCPQILSLARLFSFYGVTCSNVHKQIAGSKLWGILVAIGISVWSVQRTYIQRASAVDLVTTQTYGQLWTQTFLMSPPIPLHPLLQLFELMMHVGIKKFICYDISIHMIVPECSSSSEMHRPMQTVHPDWDVISLSAIHRSWSANILHRSDM